MSDKSIEELIEASSLGTPAAKAARESVSDEDAQRIVDRVNQMRAPCVECGCTRERCDGYLKSRRKCCPDCKHRPT